MRGHWVHGKYMEVDWELAMGPETKRHCPVVASKRGFMVPPQAGSDLQGVGDEGGRA